MIRRSISRAATSVSHETIPITSRRCHSSMRGDSTAGAVFLIIAVGAPPLLQCRDEARSLAALRRRVRVSHPLRPQRGAAAGRRIVYRTPRRSAASPATASSSRSCSRLTSGSRAGSSSRSARPDVLGQGARARVRRADRDLLRRRRSRLALDAGDEQNLTPEGWDSSRAGAYALSFVAIVFVGPIARSSCTAAPASRSSRRTARRWRWSSPPCSFGLGHGLCSHSPRSSSSGS